MLGCVHVKSPFLFGNKGFQLVVLGKYSNSNVGKFLIIKRNNQQGKVPNNIGQVVKLFGKNQYSSLILWNYKLYYVYTYNILIFT
jgi:hypothetical protein